LDKLERIKATLQGQSVDRPPYSFWTHLPGVDLEPQRLAQESAAFAKRFDIDVLKSMPNGLYCVEDWGCVCDYSEIARGGVAKVVVPAVTSTRDWAALEHVDVTQGAFGRELEHLARLVELVGPGLPVLATVFSPLTIAAKLSNDASREHLRQAPDAVIPGLETITAVTCEFARATIARGCAGIFLATQDATHSAFSEADYRKYGEPYDARVIAAAKAAGGWFNAVHAHGEDILFDVIRDYDVEALNWHIGETPPSIAEYRESGGRKAILGGLQRAHLTQKNREGIAADIATALAPNGGRGVIVAPACVIRHPVDAETLLWTADRIKSGQKGLR
jgi:uroporphyrinogen decarboxylase